jgi:hypothetical protein
MLKTLVLSSSGRANKAMITPWINQTTIITPTAAIIGQASTT